MRGSAVGRGKGKRQKEKGKGQQQGARATRSALIFGAAPGWFSLLPFAKEKGNSKARGPLRPRLFLVRRPAGFPFCLLPFAFSFPLPAAFCLCACSGILRATNSKRTRGPAVLLSFLFLVCFHSEPSVPQIQPQPVSQTRQVERSLLTGDYRVD